MGQTLKLIVTLMQQFSDNRDSLVWFVVKGFFFHKHVRSRNNGALPSKQTTVRFMVGYTVGLQRKHLHWFPINSKIPNGGLEMGQWKTSYYLLY